MTKYKFIPEQVLYSLLAAFVIAMFWHLAAACFYSDSEIWLLTLSQQTFSSAHLTSVLYKWSFHAITFLFSHYAPSEVDVYTQARAGWAVVALGSQAIVAYSFSIFVDKKKLFLPIFIAITTFSAFFNQGFRIRGDILSLFMHAVILLSIFKLRDAKIRWFHYLWIFTANTILVLSTPKSFYLYVSQFVFAIGIYNLLKVSRSYFLLIWITHISPIVIIFGLAIATHVFPSPIDLIKPIHEAADFYLKSFDSDLFNPEYLSVIDFAHIIKALAKSPAHAVVFFFGVALYLYSSFRPKKQSVASALNMYFGVLLLCVVFHNQKFPFFIGTFGTPLAAYTFVLVNDALERFLKSYRRFATMALCSAMTFFAILEYGLNLSLNNNIGQQIAIEHFDKYMTRHPEYVFYDIIGMLPRKTTIFLFVGPGEISRKNLIIDELDRVKPDIILFTYKFIFLEPDIRYYLTKKRVTIEPNVWVEGDVFSILKNVSYFRQAIQLRGNNYWRIPHPPKKYIYTLADGRSIKYEVIYLKNGIETKHLEEADSFAIPSVYLDLVQTNVEPIGFLQHPFFLFRYDTNF